MDLDNIIWHGEPTVLSFYETLIGSGLLCAASIVTFVMFSKTSFWWGSVLGLLVAVLVLGFAFNKAWSTTYIISEYGVRREFHFIVFEVNELPLNKITDVIVSQDIVGRIFGFGTVRVGSCSISFQEVLFSGVRRPEEVRRIIFEARKKALAN